MPITTTAEIEQRLKLYDITFAKVTPLSSGSENFVWRVLSPDGSTTVIKHAEPYAKDTPHIPYNTNRMEFEKKALETLPYLIPQDEILRVPVIRSYHSEDKTLQMADGGPRTLKEAYTNPMLNIPALGRRVGTWLARLHSSTRGEKERNAFRNDTAKGRYRHAYDAALSISAELGHDVSVVEAIKSKYEPLIQYDSESICHGDFWPGNIIVQSVVSYGWSNTKLTVVDWENVRDGCGAADVAQFAAEAWLLDRYKGGRGLYENFLRGYGEGVRENEGEIRDEFREKVAAHFGIYVIISSTKSDWDTKETGKVIELAFDILKKVLLHDVQVVGEAFPGL